MQVWKYQLPLMDEITIHMPSGAKPLHIATQHDAPCMWALVDPAQPIAPHHFVMLGTGHDIDAVGAYVGSFLAQNDRLVLHVFYAS